MIAITLLPSGYHVMLWKSNGPAAGASTSFDAATCWPCDPWQVTVLFRPLGSREKQGKGMNGWDISEIGVVAQKRGHGGPSQGGWRRKDRVDLTAVQSPLARMSLPSYPPLFLFSFHIFAIKQPTYQVAHVYCPHARLHMTDSVLGTRVHLRVTDCVLRAGLVAGKKERP